MGITLLGEVYGLIPWAWVAPQSKNMVKPGSSSPKSTNPAENYSMEACLRVLQVFLYFCLTFETHANASRNEELLILAPFAATTLCAARWN